MTKTTAVTWLEHTKWRIPNPWFPLARINRPIPRGLPTRACISSRLRLCHARQRHLHRVGRCPTRHRHRVGRRPTRRPILVEVCRSLGRRRGVFRPRPRGIFLHPLRHRGVFRLPRRPVGSSASPRLAVLGVTITATNIDNQFRILRKKSFEMHLSAENQLEGVAL